MTRREFTWLLVGSMAAGAAPARAGEAARVRRVGVLGPLPAADPIEKARLAAFLQGLRQLGWSEDRNLRIDYRASVGGIAEWRRDARELVASAPDIIMVSSSGLLAALLQAADRIPIVFVNVADPVGAGFVTSLARPGRNVTGFTPLEYGTSAKWLELLREVAPGITRVAVLRETRSPGSMGQLAAIEAAAAMMGVALHPIDASDPAALENAIASFAGGTDGGLIVPAIPSLNIYRELLITLAARHRLPAVYAFRPNVVAGGLMSYGPDQFDLYRQAAGYVHRILNGETAGDLPVQTPVKYELVLNLKTAKVLGLGIPAAVLARADEVIE